MESKMIKKQEVELDLITLKTTNLPYPFKQGDNNVHEITLKLDVEEGFEYERAQVHYSNGDYQDIQNLTFIMKNSALENGIRSFEVEFVSGEEVRRSGKVGYRVDSSINSKYEAYDKYNELKKLYDVYVDAAGNEVQREQLKVELIELKNSIVSDLESINLAVNDIVGSENDREQNEVIREEIKVELENLVIDIQNKLDNGDFVGEKGDVGPQGEIGPKGKDGVDVKDGIDGTMVFEDLTPEQKETLKGDKGEQGIQGEKGDTGDQGVQGEKGDIGDQGPKGDKGDQGIQGEIGPKGDTGDIESLDAQLITDALGYSPLPISGGMLENYTEKLTTVTASDGSINLSLGNVFQHSPSGNTTYSITNAVNSQAHSFTLIINMGTTARTLTFPASVKWQGGEIPDLSTASKTYVLTFLTINGGATWLGMFGGEF